MKSTRLKSSLNTQGNDYFNRPRFHLTNKNQKNKQMKKYISFLSAFFAYFLAYPQSFPGILTDRVEKLDAMLDDAIANQRVPGLVAMVLKDGGACLS